MHHREGGRELSTLIADLLMDMYMPLQLAFVLAQYLILIMTHGLPFPHILCLTS